MCTYHTAKVGADGGVHVLLPPVVAVDCCLLQALQHANKAEVNHSYLISSKNVKEKF